MFVVAAAAAAVSCLCCNSGGPFGRTELVGFSNRDVRLEGTLHLPEGEGAHPAAVFVHGSGPDTREGYRPYAEYLARHGIATLTYDKRGTGASTGDWRRATFEDLARDALAAIDSLRRDPRIDPERIGLVGISQGGWIAPLAATLSTHVGFVVTVSASGVSPSNQVLYQWANRFRDEGASPAQVEAGQEVIRRVWEYALGERDWESASRALSDGRSAEWFRAAADKEGLWEALPRPEDLTWMTPWLRCKDFDPVPVWSRVSVPVLLLYGELDESVPVRESMAIIEQALRDGDNADHRVHVFPRADHGIRVDGRLAAGYPALLASWILDEPNDGE